MIFPVESQSRVRTKPALPLTTTLGAVHIAVTNRDKALSIWRDELRAFDRKREQLQIKPGW